MGCSTTDGNAPNQSERRCAKLAITADFACKLSYDAARLQKFEKSFKACRYAMLANYTGSPLNSSTFDNRVLGHNAWQLTMSRIFASFLNSVRAGWVKCIWPKTAIWAASSP
jgi:hypothetical protein